VPRTRNNEEQKSPDDNRCQATSISLQELRKVIAKSRKIVPDDTDEDLNNIRCFLDETRAQYSKELEELRDPTLKDPAHPKCTPAYEQLLEITIGDIDALQSEIARTLGRRGNPRSCTRVVLAPGESNPQVAADYGPIRHNRFGTASIGAKPL